jgi:hypothetical protein
MKKVFCFILALSLALGLSACRNDNNIPEWAKVESVVAYSADEFRNNANVITYDYRDKLITITDCEILRINKIAETQNCCFVLNIVPSLMTDIKFYENTYKIGDVIDVKGYLIYTQESGYCLAPCIVLNVQPSAT